MNIEYYREFCLSLPHVTEDFPFDKSVLAFRVGGKIFSLSDVDSFEYANLKCDPDRALELREQYSGVRPGYHMNKKHWNSVYSNDDVPDELFLELAKHSYDLIKSSLPASVRRTLDE